MMMTNLPTPYYDQDGITIYHADCRDILPLLEPGSVDLVLTDPPYGIGLKENGRHGYNWNIVGDANQEIGQIVLGWAASRDVATVTFAAPRKPWPGEWRQLLVWDKGGAVGGGGDIETCWKFSWELIQVARTGILNGRRDEAVLRFPVGQRNYHDHPAQKPVELVQYLLGKVGGTTILDPFMGSGTTLRAAKDLGRKAIGIEIEERYCEIAVKRLAQQVLPFEMVAD